MKHLYAPWRDKYIHKKTAAGLCIFCFQADAQQDADHFIIKRFAHCFVLLNLYPYNAGHLLVIPYEHHAMLEDLSAAARAEIMEVTTQCNVILKQALGANGINIGLNVGSQVAGGSIPEHLHMHVVPRWLGDTNFLVTIAETKPISFSLPAIYQKLRASF